jgi:hypothetical protein
MGWMGSVGSDGLVKWRPWVELAHVRCLGVEHCGEVLPSNPADRVARPGH